MRVLNFALLGASFIPTVLGFLDKRVFNDPVNDYISRVCYPIYTNNTGIDTSRLTLGDRIASLAGSPFPCEQVIYLELSCMANGTTEIDFLAEQQCLCGSSIFESFNACNECFLSHGFIASQSPEQASAQIASLQTAECSPSPPYQPFSNLFPTVNITSVRLAPSMTLGNDRFPNMTAVSNYATLTRSATPGLITGSATGRLRSVTNISGIRYTPSSTPSQFATTSHTVTSSTGTSSTGTGTAGGAGGGSSSTSSAATSATTKNAGSRGEAQAAGGLLAAAVAAVVLL